MLQEFLTRFTGRKRSSDEAKKRLQFSLVYDKLEVNDTTLTDLQTDIVNVISKYFEIDKDALELKVKNDNQVSALVFNTPILVITSYSIHYTKLYERPGSPVCQAEAAIRPNIFSAFLRPTALPVPGCTRG